MSDLLLCLPTAIRPRVFHRFPSSVCTAALLFIGLTTSQADWSAQLRESPIDSVQSPPPTRLAFAGSTIPFEIDFRGSSDSAIQIYLDLFQTSLQTAVPVLSRHPLGPCFRLEPGKPYRAPCEISLPHSLTQGLVLGRVFANTTPVALLSFKIIPNEVLNRITKHSIRVTDAKLIRQAFLDRDLRVVSSIPDELNSEWQGLWFFHRSQDSKTPIPTRLKEHQCLVLLEDDEDFASIPVARQAGEGWILKFRASLFADFPTNATVQSMLEMLIQETQALP